MARLALRDAINQIVLDEFDCVGYQMSISTGPGQQSDMAYGSTTFGRPMLANTLHQTWCLTKPFLALAVQWAIDSGELQCSLESSVKSLRKQFPGLANNDAAFLDVMCHDAGLALPRAVDLWMSPTGERSDLLSSASTSHQAMSSYSEVVGWYLLELFACGGSSSGLVRRFVEAVDISVNDVVMDAAWLAQTELTERLGAYYSSSANGIRVPMLHDFIPSVQRTISPVLGGLTTARGMCHFYSNLLHNPNLDRSLARLLEYRRGRSWDFVLERSVDFAAGFMVELTDFGYGQSVSSTAFGYTGWLGGSFAFADPAQGFAMAFVQNTFLPPDENERLRIRVIDAVLASVA
jgi:CubicO group peptidase (beta-lactamase class C family)